MPRVLTLRERAISESEGLQSSRRDRELKELEQQLKDAFGYTGIVARENLVVIEGLSFRVADDQFCTETAWRQGLLRLEVKCHPNDGGESWTRVDSLGELGDLIRDGRVEARL